MGLFIMYLLSAVMFLYGYFFEAINYISQAGFFYYLKLLVYLGICVYLALMLFVLSFGKTTANYTEDVVIVLGAGVNKGVVSTVLQNRLDACISYYNKNPEVYIVVSGGLTRHKDGTEAEAMKKYLISKGIPHNIILLEDKSQSTKENYLFSKKILVQNNIKYDKIAFITNSFHIYRAKTYAEFCGFSGAESISTKTDLTMFLPSLVREVLGVIDMWLFKLSYKEIFE